MRVRNAGGPRRWPIILLIIVSIAVAHFWALHHVGKPVKGVGNFDSAWYYQTARNFAVGRGLIDNVVWQYLAPPTAAWRPAGEYWPIGWPLFLSLLMRVFGTSQTAALNITWALSVSVPLLCAHLAWRCMRTNRDDEPPVMGFRAETIALLAATSAGLLVALQPRLQQVNVITDSSMPYVVVVGAGLAAYAWSARRTAAWSRVVAGIVLAGSMTVRGEGFIPLLTAAICALTVERGALYARLKAAGLLLTGGVIGHLPHVLFNVWQFGATNPPAKVRALWMLRYDDIFDLGSQPTFHKWWNQGLTTLAQIRWNALAANLKEALHTVPLPVLVLAVVGALLAFVVRGRRRLHLLSLFIVLSWLIPSLMAPVVVTASRFVSHCLPFACILASVAIIDIAWAPLGILRAKGPSIQVVRVGLAGTLLVISLFWYYPTRWTYTSPFNHIWVFAQVPSYAKDTLGLQRLQLKPTDVVLTEYSWQVSAFLDVSSVRLPNGGREALHAAVEKYDVDYVLTTERGTLFKSFFVRPDQVVPCYRFRRLGQARICAIRKPASPPMP